MCVPRIRARVPSARPVATGFVRQRRFLFHKLSQDGSAKADAALTGRPDDRVWGVVLRVRKDEKPILDRHEFLGVGYDEHQETIVLPDGNSVRACVYVARTEAIEKDVKPYSWYKAFVLHGAREHRLPDDYVAQLERFACMVDPNQQRHEANHRLLTHEASCPDGSSMSSSGRKFSSERLAAVYRIP